MQEIAVDERDAERPARAFHGDRENEVVVNYLALHPVSLLFPKAWIETDCFSVVRLCLVQVSFFRVDDASAIIGIGILRIEPYGLGVVVNGVVGLVLVVVYRTPAIVGIGMFRIEPYGLGVVLNGLVQLPFLTVGDGSAVVGIGMFRIEPYGLSVVLNGLVQLPFRTVGDGSVVVGFGKLWIEPV